MSDSDINEWRTVEADEYVVVVADWSDREVLVYFDTGRKSWVCDECPRSARATTTCAHVGAAVRDLDLSILLRIASIVHRSTPASRQRSKEDREAERTVADTLARSAERRAARNRAHDEQHHRISAPISVRRVSAADRQRLEETRRRRARTTSPFG
jgi:hypothetical protein